jgi:hypothetical protein
MSIYISFNVPELPEKFNPEKLEVEYSSIGVRKSGNWLFYFDFVTDEWDSLPSGANDNGLHFYARLLTE